MKNNFSLVKELNKLDKKELIILVRDLSKINKDNKIYLKTKLSQNFEELLELSFKKLDKCFYCFELLSLRDARKVLIDFNKLCGNKGYLLKLYFYYLDLTQELSYDWRVQENLILAIERVFKMFVEILKNDKILFNKYDTKVKQFIKKSTEGFGHRESLEEIYLELKKNEN